jgi:hypothetical protein
MSMPLYCPGCGELVGVDNYPFAALHPHSSIAEIACPGKSKHQPSVRTTERKFFGLVERVTVKYLETRTSSSWNEYVGPRRPFYIWLAIMFGEDKSIVVNGKWCWWDFKHGFHGNGAKEF